MLVEWIHSKLVLVRGDSCVRDTATDYFTQLSQSGTTVNASPTHEAHLRYPSLISPRLLKIFYPITCDSTPLPVDLLIRYIVHLCLDCQGRRGTAVSSALFVVKRIATTCMNSLITEIKSTLSLSSDRRLINV